MDYHFLNIFMEKKDLLSQKSYDINSFLLENNKDQLEKIYDFYNGDAKLMYVNGFLGTGKADCRYGADGRKSCRKGHGWPYQAYK